MKSEYPAMIYKNSRTKGFIANCIVKNVMGFGKTEEDALKNLKDSMNDVENVIIKPVYNFSIVN